MKFTFGLQVNVSGVQAGLPPHGHIVPVDDCGNAVAPPFHRPLFSIAAVRACINGSVDKGLVDADNLGRLEKDLADSGLPEEVSRFDRIIEVLGFSLDTLILVQRLAGVLKPGEQPTPARFEVCHGGKLCRYKNCDRYGTHGAFFIENTDGTRVEPVFSYENAMETLAKAGENGFFTADDRMRLAQQVEAAGLAPKKGRADRLVECHEIASKERFLDIIFGLYVPKKPARFVPCGTRKNRHFHLFAFDNKKYAAEPISSRVHAEALLDLAVCEGAISESDRVRIASEYDAIGMPAAKPGEVAVSAALDQLLAAIKDASNE